MNNNNAENTGNNKSPIDLDMLLKIGTFLVVFTGLIIVIVK
ncbi:hypothetical protein [Sporosarcina sp. BP05]|nr:hypothetical protein [Sporosarcina sp. BP05]